MNRNHNYTFHTFSKWERGSLYIQGHLIVVSMAIFTSIYFGFNEYYEKYFKLKSSLTELVLSFNGFRCLEVPILKSDMVRGENGDIISGTMSATKQSVRNQFWFQICNTGYKRFVFYLCDLHNQCISM